MSSAAPGDPFDHGGPVQVVDEITVRPGCQREVYALLTGEYAARAATRELRLTGAVLSPPIERPAATSELLLVWEYPTLDAHWAARMAEESDAVVARIWADVERMSVRRTRRVGRSAPMPAGSGRYLDFTAAPPIAPPAVHRILFVGPPPALSEEARLDWRRAAASAVRVPGVVTSEAGFHEPYSFMPGEMTWDLTMIADVPVERLLTVLPGRAEIAGQVELGAVLDSGLREPGLTRGIKRTVLMKTADGLPAERIAEFERTLLEVPRYIPELRNWRFSRVARSTGAIAWTHCIEHEVPDADVLLGPYLNHPYHWAVVERLFHPEAPERCSAAFGQSLYRIGRSVIFAG